MKPLIILNLKTYQQGKKAIKLAKEIEKVNKEIIVGVQASDIYEISSKTHLKVYAQHVDYFLPGRNTGYILPEAVKKDGAKGTFLNHSEHPLNLATLKKTIERCKKTNLKTAVFASNILLAKKIEKLKPTFLIYEPPQLVAGNISVSISKPDIIKNMSKKVKMPFLVGAGIKTKEDIDIAINLGAKGVALSSIITKAKNPKKVLKSLL